MESGAESDLDVQAYCRSLALQQIQMLTRLAEIAMQLAEAEGARALAAQAVAAQARAARPEADEAAVEAAKAEAQEAGMAFGRFSRSVQRSLALRGRAADSLCARDKAQAADREAARQDRRDRHRNEVEGVLRHMIWDEIEDFSRVEALHAELEERVEDLYDDETVPVEDRPLGSVMAGLACGLGLTEEWGRWSPAWPGTPDPARPAGDAAGVEAERARRRDAAVAAVERSFADLRDPARIPGIRAGLAARLREPDVTEWLDTETTQTVARRLCRSLGIDPHNCFERPDIPDTG